MKTTDLMRQRIEEFAKQMQAEFGPLMGEKEGCLLEAAEAWGVQLGDELARSVTKQELPTAAESPQEATCPRCERAGRRKKQRKRRIETRRGVIHIEEPEYYCPHCRRAFFPDDQRLGDAT